MATRMQQRRGTAAQWTTANPIMAAGEIGVEVDTGEFRLGDGVSTWVELSPFKNLDDLGGSLDDYVTLDSVGANLGVAPLDANGQVPLTHLTQLANLDSPTFGGTVVLPTTTSVGAVSSDELGYLNGVTSPIQTQLGDKADSATVATTYATINNPTFTGTVALPSSTSIGNITATELSFITTLTSDAQDQLDTKAPISSPTFTGTVSGVTKSMVGLGSVDNTTDESKPVSTATQTALDDKLNLTGGTLTGLLTLSGDPTVGLHAATKDYVDNVSSNLNFHAPVEAATTGNVTLSGTQTVDGVALVAGDRVLVKNQTNLTQNGIYVVASGSWSRAADADDIPTKELTGGDFTLALRGTVNSGFGFVVSNTSEITIGTTDITYVPFNAGHTVAAGTGLTETTPGVLEVNTSVIAPVNNPTFTGTVTLPATGATFSDGAQARQGVPSITTITSRTASYTLASLEERDTIIEILNAGATTLTIPTDATINYPVGTTLDVLQTGAGQVTIAGSAGVTVNATPGLRLRTQWSSVTLLKRAANTWLVFGDLTA